jgi:hypothetical protein
MPRNQQGKLFSLPFRRYLYSTTTASFIAPNRPNLLFISFQPKETLVTRVSNIGIFSRNAMRPAGCWGAILAPYATIEK